MTLKEENLSHYLSSDYLTRNLLVEAAKLLEIEPEQAKLYSWTEFAEQIKGLNRYCRAVLNNIPRTYGNSLEESLILWQCRDNSSIKMVTFGAHVRTDYSAIKKFIVLQKGEVFRAKRYLIKKEREIIKSSVKKPLLPSSLWGGLISSTLNFLASSHEFFLYNTKCTKGILLTGPPGNGKTMFCNYLKSLLLLKGIQVVCLTSQQIIKKINDGDNPFLQRVVFVDDIDIDLLNRRGQSSLACDLLSKLDGFGQSHRTSLRIFSTNELINNIDPAFLRPGRIDKCFVFDNPNTETRSEFIHSWSDGILESIDIKSCISRSEGLSFAELDLLKQLLVSEYLENKLWDLNKAFHELSHRNAIADEKMVGFNQD